MTNPDETTRRDFIRRVGVGAVAAAGAVAAVGADAPKRIQTMAKGRILGANDRINVGFVGCGGRMNTHIRRVMERSKAAGRRPGGRRQRHLGQAQGARASGDRRRRDSPSITTTARSARGPTSTWW